MDLQSFIETYQLAPECIDGPACLDTLLEQMAEGLAGRGNIPMIPSYLSLDTQPEIGMPCSNSSMICSASSFGGLRSRKTPLPFV